MNLTIFNSWQSDSPHNSKGVRAALREACNKLESQVAGLHAKIDEATSNQVGALHIPNAILQNISSSDVFVVVARTGARPPAASQPPWRPTRRHDDSVSSFLTHGSLGKRRDWRTKQQTNLHH
jgi:hypothetical protein